MTKRKIGAVCGSALLIAAAVVVALRERQQVLLPEVPVAQTPADMRVKTVERKAEPVEQRIWTLFASRAHLRACAPTLYRL